MKTPWQKLFWIVRRPAVQLFKNLYVQYKNPDAHISSPIIWKYDDIKAIAIGADTLIDPFCQIVVEASSPFSNVPGRLIIGK